MGIPFDDSTLPTSNDPLAQPFKPVLLRPPRVTPNWLYKIFSSSDPEAPTSIYYTLLEQERYSWRKYIIYDWLTYGALVSQLVLSAALIILGALPSSHHISISIIGAAGGVLAGILSILKGQGLPTRLLRYADGLRQVREAIEFDERELRVGLKYVTLGDAMAHREAYENARSAEITNMPDVWQAAEALKGGKPGAAGTTTSGPPPGTFSKIPEQHQATLHTPAPVVPGDHNV
ncbi:hypothetical protein BT63DRAFT_423762 [Microthyrium microscopicum]|uniref:SMODS and SLOG-associating 2TM effector domain-containing protein n=1 Tax=Microthyrium microscopicum TaxID=703497 RepID=A0A6A6UE80_9PEZI|nr:hypothetical protein BT63DRAFT_423762 [Microthyrium microscopicum]